MDIIELKKQIIKNELSNFYVFTGSEIEIQNIYLEKMSNILNLPIVRVDSVSEIYAKCTTRTLFGAKNCIYVIREDRDFIKAEKLHGTIKKDIKKNVIVLQYEKLDSRTKFSKTFKDCIVPFEPLTRRILKKYINLGCSIKDHYCDILAEICNGSYDLSMLECDKINQYADAMNIPTEQSMKTLVESGVIYQPEESDVFEFTHAVCMHNIQDAFYLEQVLRKNNISVINILGTLYNSLKTVLLIQVCESKDVSKVTGIDSKVIYANNKYLNKYDSSILVHGIKQIIRVVDDIKNGKIDDIYAVRYIMVNLM